MSAKDTPTPMESIAKILIINDKRETLVLTLGEHLKYPEKSYLPDLPGGIVDPGESEQLAAIRETKEETGIGLDQKSVQLAYAQTTYIPEENKSITKMLYIAHVEDTPKVTLSWEHSDCTWVPLDELHTIELRPFFKQAVEYVVTKGLV